MGILTVHRLIQLVMRKWLIMEGKSGEWAGKALAAVAKAYLLHCTAGFVLSQGQWNKAEEFQLQAVETRLRVWQDTASRPSKRHGRRLQRGPRSNWSDFGDDFPASEVKISRCCLLLRKPTFQGWLCPDCTATKLGIGEEGQPRPACSCARNISPAYLWLPVADPPPT
jgi:hypothetical protein